MKNIWIIPQFFFISFVTGKNTIGETLYKEILLFQSVTQNLSFVSDGLAL